MNVNQLLTADERKIMESAVIGVAGAGGLGSNCAMHLVRSGIKHLVIADFDFVSPSNLNRQFFFRDQIGQPKVKALAANLYRIEPELSLELHAVRLDADNLTHIFEKCSIVAEAFDNADAKAMLISTLLPTGKPVVSVSGVAGWGRSGELQVRRAGKNLILIGDFSSGVEPGIPPFAPRVGIAAAMEANTIAALLLNKNI